MKVGFWTWMLVLHALGVFLFLRYFRHRLALSGRQRGGRGASRIAFFVSQQLTVP